MFKVKKFKLNYTQMWNFFEGMELCSVTFNVTKHKGA